MTLAGIDWAIIIGFFTVALGIGLYCMRQAGKSEGEFFLGGRSMPWWLLGFSMVATTFSTDTPNFVTNVVRKDGVAGNWSWWAFLLTGMLTVFVYAKLWRRSRVTTDVEFYELRYSGKAAAFLRAFRGVYLGVLYNVLIMAMVTLAAIKIGGVMLGLSPLESILAASLVTVLFSTLGGFKGVILTDFLLFLMAMVGAAAAAWYALDHPAVGGLDGMMTQFRADDGLASKLAILPAFDNTDLLVSVLIMPLAVQWWAAYYPGSEPGGGGYLVQRMLAAKNEKHALGATLFFNVAHYALRPWPWIIVALASLLIYPMDPPAVSEAAKTELEGLAAQV
ncbi:MAG: sodium:solute symporter family transporter, partial [Planctomycetota bacterium]